MSPVTICACTWVKRVIKCSECPSLSKETTRRARLESRTSRSGVRVFNRSATQAAHQTVYVYTNVVSLPIFLALKNISSTSCTNQDQNCLSWANTDERCKNPAYMLEYCCASCKAKGNQVIFKIGSQMVSALRLQCIVDEKFFKMAAKLETFRRLYGSFFNRFSVKPR